MNAHRTGKRTILMSVFAAILLLPWIVSPPSAQALMALPDIGINYQTMTVTQAKKLIAAGMKNAENGDRITMSVSKEKKLIFFKNLRTNEDLSYPPERPLERSR
jgi:hypothetical protein